MAVRLISITHTFEHTEILGQEVLPLPRVSFGNATIADRTWTQYQAITPFTLPPAENHKESYVYRLEGLPTGGTFDPESREVAGMPIGIQSATPLRYIVTDADNPTSTDELGFNITVNRAALELIGTAHDYSFLYNREIDASLLEKQPYARGGTGEIDYSASVLPAGVTFDDALRKPVGTPTTSGESVMATYTAEDENGTQVTDTFSMTVSEVLALAQRSDVYVIDGNSVNIFLGAASGGIPPYTYSASGFGDLTFSGGRISGTPSTSRTISYSVTDALGDSVSRSFNLFVVPVLAIEGLSVQNLDTTSTYTYTLPAATGGTSPYTYTLTEVHNTGGEFVWSWNSSTREVTVDTGTQEHGTLELRYGVSDSGAANGVRQTDSASVFFQT